VDFDGPLGPTAAAGNTGRREPLSSAPVADIEASRRQVLPLVELRSSFELSGEEMDAVERGAEDPNPTFAKVLVRYNPGADPALNQRQTARLTELSGYCRAAGRRFMFELLVPATQAQMDRVQADQATYDLRVRPALMLRTIRALQDAGVEPDVWKIEGLDRREDCERVVDTARRDGRRDIGCIVLGRGADEQKVVRRLTVAASVPGFIGFAVGRTTFWDAVADYVGKRATRPEAVSCIARCYREWAAIFEPGRSP